MSTKKKIETEEVEEVEEVVEVTEELLREKGFKKIKFQDMIQYIENYAPTKKDWFKHVVESSRLVTEDKETGEKVVGGYNHLACKKAFCKEFFPDLIPTPKAKKQSVLDFIKNW